MAAISLATRWGPGIDVDSVSYLNAAENIAAGNGIVITRGPDEHYAMTHWPPVYSIVLAAGTFLGLDALSFARLIGIVLIGANVFVVGILIRRYVRDDFPALIGASLVATSYAVVLAHAYALSEALFTLCCVLAVAGLASYGDTPKRWIICLAAIAAAAATLTRYSGLALIAAGMITLLLANAASIRRRFFDVSLFGAISLAPVVVWSIRNSLVGAPSIGRDLGLESFKLYHLKSFLSGLSLWLFPVSVDRFVRLSLTVVVLVAIAAGLVYCYRRVRDERRRANWPPVLFVCLVFVVSYWALYAATIVLADNGVSLSTRTQMPAFVLTVVLVAVLAGNLLPLGARFRQVRNAQIALGVCLALLASVNTAKFLSDAYHKGLGFSSDRWRQSEIIAMIKRAPQEDVIYTNLPAGVEFHAGKRTRTRTIKGARWTGLSDAAHISRLRPIIAEAKKKSSRIYYFKNYSSTRQVTEQEFADTLGLVPVSRHSDGTVYKVR